MRLPAFALVGAGMAAAARLARRERYDVIHSHWPLPMGLPAQAGAWATQVAGIKPRLVATFHGAEVALARRKSHYRPVLGWLTRNLDAAVANSSSTATTVRELTGVEAHVIPFGPPRGTVELNREPDSHSPAARRFTAERLTHSARRRAHDRAQRLSRYWCGPRIRLRGRARVVIVGGGEYEPVVRKEIERRRAGDVVELAGRVSNAALSDLYSRCAVFCLPAIVDSRGETEGLGVVLVEAMSHGKPVVASRLGGIVDAVADGDTGILVPPQDPDILAKTLLRVVEEPGLAERLGEAGRERAKRLFSWDGIAERHLDLYEAARASR